MVRQLTVATTLSLFLGLAPQLMASPRVLVRAHTGFYYGRGYHWYPGPRYPDTFSENGRATHIDMEVGQWVMGSFDKST